MAVVIILYYVNFEWFNKMFVEILKGESVYADVYGSFIHNCPNLEAAKMSFSRWIDK